MRHFLFNIFYNSDIKIIITCLFSAPCNTGQTINNSASVDPNPTSQSTGYTWTVTCVPGYTVSAPNGTMVCDTRGIWTNKPLCNINSCNAGQTILNSAAIDPSPTSQDTGYSWNVSCNPGYTVSASNGSMVCDEEGSWINKPTCIPNPCIAGQTIAHSASVVPSPTSENSGYVWTVSCTSGYNVSAATGSMVCNGSGSWTNKPSCNINTCTAGQTINNSASVDPTTSQSTGYSWTVSCNSGYSISAATGTMVCDVAGSWTNKPSCIANTCNAGQSIANSASVLPSPTSQSTGYVWTVSCTSGYNVSAVTGSMVCDGSGLWTNKPSCNINSCTAGQTINNSASVDPTTSQNTGYSWNVSCNSGYSISTATGTMVCDVGGSWTNKPFCSANACNVGQSISNSASVDPNPTSQSTGYSWTVSCNSGYSISAATGAMVCDVAGSWTNKPSCIANVCGLGQTITYSASVDPNSTNQSTGYSWTVTCNSGYSISAATGTMICDVAGSWTNKPSCSANTCNVGQTISNSASVNPNPTSQSTGYSWNVSCNSGYSISAASGAMVCDVAGSWTNKPSCIANVCGFGQTITNSASVDPNPTNQSTGYLWNVSCNSGYSVSATTGAMVCDVAGSWTNEPSCIANACNSGETIANSGSIDPSPTSQRTGYLWTVTCNAGYTVSNRTGSMVCNSGGSWTNKPSCNINSCTAGQTINNSASVDPTTAQNTGYSWNVSCNPGYTVSAGNGSMICNAAGFWTNKPSCNANACSPGQTISNSASVDPNPTSQSTGYLWTVTCNSGYSVSAGSGTMICDGGGSWTNMPSCIGMKQCTFLIKTFKNTGNGMQIGFMLNNDFLQSTL